MITSDTMEELIVIILQVGLEILVQVVAELPWDLFISSRGSGFQSTAPAKPGAVFLGFLSLLAGGLLGGASLLVFPTTLLHWGAARMANLLLAPAVSAFVSYYFAGIAPIGASRINPKIRAICAACFTFALALVRFTYATRPHA